MFSPARAQMRTPQFTSRPITALLSTAIGCLSLFSAQTFAASPAGGDVPAIELSKSRWMTDGYQNQAHKRLRDICIPGSHDTGTYSITSGVDENISQTQNLNVYQQLEQGYRYFDLRFKKKDGEWIAFHGPSNGAPFLEIAIHLQLFATLNPQEILLLKVLVEGSSSEKRELYDLLEGFLGHRMAPRSLGTGASFEDFWNIDKNVAILWTSGDYASYSKAWSFSSTITDPWANRTNINGLIGHQQDKADDPRYGKIFVHQIIRTPFGQGGNWRDDATDFFETSAAAASIENMSKQLDAAAMVYLLDKTAKASGQRVNVAMIDFLEYQKVWEACMDVNDLETNNWFKLRNKKRNTCLRANGDTPYDGSGVHLGGCDNYSGAKWRYVHATDQLISGKWDAYGNYCLDSRNQNHNNGRPGLWWCDDNRSQQNFVLDRDVIRHNGSHFVLDAYNDSDIGFWGHNGGQHQTWQRLY